MGHNRDRLQGELLEVRKASGLNASQLSERLHVPQRTLEAWISGRRLPPEWSARYVVLELWRQFPR